MTFLKADNRIQASCGQIVILLKSRFLPYFYNYQDLVFKCGSCRGREASEIIRELKYPPFQQENLFKEPFSGTFLPSNYTPVYFPHPTHFFQVPGENISWTVCQSDTSTLFSLTFRISYACDCVK